MGRLIPRRNGKRPCGHGQSRRVWTSHLMSSSPAAAARVFVRFDLPAKTRDGRATSDTLAGLTFHCHSVEWGESAANRHPLHPGCRIPGRAQSLFLPDRRSLGLQPPACTLERYRALHTARTYVFTTSRCPASPKESSPKENLTSTMRFASLAPSLAPPLADPPHRHINRSSKPDPPEGLLAAPVEAPANPPACCCCCVLPHRDPIAFSRSRSPIVFPPVCFCATLTPAELSDVFHRSSNPPRPPPLEEDAPVGLGDTAGTVDCEVADV